MIKQAYAIYPEITYPAITIQEIENTENSRYTDDGGEQVSGITTMFAIYGTQTSDKTAEEVIDDIKNKLDTYLKLDTYKCLKRIGTVPNLPMVSDANVMIGYLKYDCDIELQTNTIYRRY